MDLPKSDESETGRRTGGHILEIYTIRGRSLGNCVFINRLAPNLGKPAFFILNRENMKVPRLGDYAKNSKLKNFGFWPSPHFPYIIYSPTMGSIRINSRYTALAAAIL